MVQVISAEVFNLGNDVTGHITYKTGLTRVGIWALTVGIVDPGWNGPIGTTLLNFSRNDYTVHTGDQFLRVSLFLHDPVPDNKLRPAPTLVNYRKDVEKLAASTFPPTFLNSDEIARSAGNVVLERVRKEALVWIGAIALVFTLIQFGARFVPPEEPAGLAAANKQIELIQHELDNMKNMIQGVNDGIGNPAR